MIDKLYGKYFQKSRSFLFPLLGIKRGSSFTPQGTYLSIDGLIGPEEIKLICSYKHDESEEFKHFEEQMLIGNPLFFKKIEMQHSDLYVFSLEIHQADYFNFILGKYSKLSNVLKRAVRSFYGEGSANWNYMETYLFPEKYFNVYATLLKMDVDDLIRVGELCDACDMEKETLKISVEDLAVLKKIE